MTWLLIATLISTICCLLTYINVNKRCPIGHKARSKRIEELVVPSFVMPFIAICVIIGFTTLVYSAEYHLPGYLKDGEPGGCRQLNHILNDMTLLEKHYAYSTLSTINDIRDLKELCDKTPRLKRIIDKINTVFIVYANLDLYQYDPFSCVSFNDLGDNQLRWLQDYFQPAFNEVELMKRQQYLKEKMTELNGKS